MPELYHVDHYDSYTYTIVAPISFVASLIFVMITLSIKEARKFPGNLLIVISLAEAGLCMHWFATGLATKYILGVADPQTDDLFCQINSLAAFVFATTELLFHFSFLLSIIVMFRNTMKKVKFLNMFWLLPVLGLIVVTYGAIIKESLGKNIYGTCSVTQTNHAGKTYLFINGMFVLMSLWAIRTVRAFKKAMKKAGRQEDEFYSFYINYITLVLFFYLLIGVLYYLAAEILECMEEAKANPKDPELTRGCFQIFYLARMINNLKVFVPLISLIFRVRDPFLQKLVLNFIETKKDPRNASVNSQRSLLAESTYDFAEDFAINEKIRESRQMIARTLLVGVHRYYEQWIHQYNKADEEGLLEKIENELSPANDPQLAAASDREIGLTQSQTLDKYYESSVISHHAKLFIGVIGADNLSSIAKSFEVGLNWETIKKSEEQTGGAGGEFFLCTYDKRYFIKTMTKKEMKTFHAVAKRYTEHISGVTGSFIARIIGMYTFRFQAGVKQTRLFVMENVFGPEKAMIDRIYDLKGSTYSRQVLIQSREQLLKMKQSKIKETLKDIDFNNIDSCLRLMGEDRDYILTLINNDVQFFRESRLIDYSLLLGVIQVEALSYAQVAQLEELVKKRRAFYTSNRELVFIPGIIDFFQLYTWQKMSEKYLKKLKKFEWGLDTSSQPPDYYAARFEAYMKVVFS